jgi:hypothetical protein
MSTAYDTTVATLPGSERKCQYRGMLQVGAVANFVLHDGRTFAGVIVAVADASFSFVTDDPLGGRPQQVEVERDQLEHISAWSAPWAVARTVARSWARC